MLSTPLVSMTDRRVLVQLRASWGRGAVGEWRVRAGRRLPRSGRKEEKRTNLLRGGARVVAAGRVQVEAAVERHVRQLVALARARLAGDDEVLVGGGDGGDGVVGVLEGGGEGLEDLRRGGAARVDVEHALAAGVAAEEGAGGVGLFGGGDLGEGGGSGLVGGAAVAEH